MKRWMIFHSSSKWDCGAYEVHKVFSDLDSALRYGTDPDRYRAQEFPMDIIVHLGELDVETCDWKVLGRLNIPDTEQMETERLEWLLK